MLTPHFSSNRRRRNGVSWEEVDATRRVEGWGVLQEDEGGMAGSRCGCRGAVLSLAPCCVVRRSMKRVCRDGTKAGSRTSVV
jgi:hypothetical protein